MTWDSAVTLVQLTFGKANGTLGESATSQVTLTPVFTGTRYLVWTATNAIWEPTTISGTTTGGIMGSIQAPAVDQDGWVDEFGNAYKNWSYLINATYSVAGSNLTITRNFNLLAGTGPIDIDVTPSSGSSIPQIVLAYPVKTINGVGPDSTGNVVVAGGGGSGTPGITSRQAKTSSFSAVAAVKYAVDATTGVVTATLPSTNAITDQIVIQKTDTSTNLVTFIGKIDGVTSATGSLRTQNQGKIFQGDGTGNWNIIAGDTSVTALDARYVQPAALNTSRPVRRAVATRASFPSSARLFTNSGSNTQVQQTMSIQVTDDSEDFVFTWGNFNRPSPSSAVLGGLSTITIRAGLYDGVNTYPIFWPNGSRDMTLEPGAWVDTKPVLYKAIKGQRLLLVWRITWATAPAQFPGSCTIANYSVDVSEWGTNLTDRTTNYAAATMFTRQAGNYAVLPPIAITASGPARPVVGILGDSISSDSVNDFTADSIDTGWAAGGLGDAGIPYIQLGTSSLLMNNIAASSVLRSQLFTAVSAAKVTHLLLPLGTNDWASGRTAAAVLADANTIRNDLLPLGVKVIPITLQPKTDATNTTNASGEPNTFAQRALYNAAIIAGNGLGDGYFDLAALTQSTANTNLWRTDLRTLSGVPTINAGGTGYSQNDVFELPGGVTTTAVTVASGVVTALSALAGTALGGWVTAPSGASQAPVRQYPGAIRSTGVTGTGFSASYPSDVAVTPTPDGTHPTAATTRWIRQNFAVVAPTLFTV